jgi:hypothetical protein
VKINAKFFHLGGADAHRYDAGRLLSAGNGGVLEGSRRSQSATRIAPSAAACRSSGAEPFVQYGSLPFAAR